MNCATRLCIALVSSITLAAAGNSQNLLVVDDDLVNPVHPEYSDIPAAVAAAVDGNHIVVYDGSYSGFTIDNEKISIYVPRGAANVNVVGPVSVKNLASDKWVVLRGFNTVVSTTSDHELKDNDGAVWIEDCSFSAPSVGLNIDACEEVTLVRSQFLGGAGSGGSGGKGLNVDGLSSSPYTTMSVWDCTAYGGTPTGAGLDGGAGARFGDDVHVFSSGSFYFGADGSDGAVGVCTDGGDGGDGALLDGSSSTLESLDLPSSAAYFVAGAGGSATSPCSAGASGTNLNVSAGSATTTSQDPRSLVVQAAAAGGGTINFLITGIAGDAYAIYGDTSPIQVPVSSPNVGHLVALPNLFGPTGTLVNSTPVQASMSLTPLSPGQSAIAFAQTWHVPTGTTTVVLSAPSTIILFNK